MRRSECSVKRVGAKLDATGTDCILDDCGKVVWFARMCVHLLLLGDASCAEFLLGGDGRNFNGRLMGSKLGGVVNVCLVCWFGGRRDEGARGTIFTKRGMKNDVWSKFVDRESGEDVLDGVVESASVMEVWEKGVGGGGWRYLERGDMCFEGSKQFTQLEKEF